MITIVSIAILIISIIIHEVAHGYMADRLGDPTARLQGRLTLNPIRHIDPVGSILVPIVTSFAGFTFRSEERRVGKECRIGCRFRLEG